MKASSFTEVGVDVSKESLDVSLGSRRLKLANTPHGACSLLGELAKLSAPIRVSCEATGCYTRHLVSACLKKGVPVSILNARAVRDFARARGQLAKTDEIDASMIAAYAKVFDPSCLDQGWTERERLIQKHKRLEVLVDTRARRKSSLHHYDDPVIRAEIRREIAALSRRIENYERQLAARIAGDPVLKARNVMLQANVGVGPSVASSLLMTFPELGTLNRREAAALAGLAPMNRDSGRGRGKRTIKGGRRKPRRALYLAALSAGRCNPLFRTHYRKLRDAGKPAKVALVAIARKLLIHLNTQLKEAPAQI